MYLKVKFIFEKNSSWSNRALVNRDINIDTYKYNCY